MFVKENEYSTQMMMSDHKLQQAGSSSLRNLVLLSTGTRGYHTIPTCRSRYGYHTPSAYQ